MMEERTGQKEKQKVGPEGIKEGEKQRWEEGGVEWRKKRGYLILAGVSKSRARPEESNEKEKSEGWTIEKEGDRDGAINKGSVHKRTSNMKYG